MSKDNEMMEQVALSDLPLAEQLRIIRGNYSIGSGEFDALDEAADVVECNQREIAGMKGERKGILKANESLSADNTRLRDEMAAKDAEIARLRTLVGELADALLAACNDTCDYCKKLLNIGDASALMCLHDGQCNIGHVYGRLAEKAREVVNG